MSYGPTEEADALYASQILERATAYFPRGDEASRTPPDEIWVAGRGRGRRRFAGSVVVVAASVIAIGSVIHGVGLGPFQTPVVIPSSGVGEGSKPALGSSAAPDSTVTRLVTLSFTRTAPTDILETSLDGSWSLDPLLVEPQGANVVDVLSIESTDYELTFDNDRLYTDAGSECSGMHAELSQQSNNTYAFDSLRENVALCEPAQRLRSVEWAGIVRNITSISLTDSETLLVVIDR